MAIVGSLYNESCQFITENFNKNISQKWELIKMLWFPIELVHRPIWCRVNLLHRHLPTQKHIIMLVDVWLIWLSFELREKAEVYKITKCQSYGNTEKWESHKKSIQLSYLDQEVSGILSENFKCQIIHQNQYCPLQSNLHPLHCIYSRNITYTLFVISSGC